MIGERDEVVIADDDAVAVVLGAVDREGLEVADEDAYEVIRALLGPPRPHRRARPAEPEETCHRDPPIAWFTGATRGRRWSTR